MGFLLPHPEVHVEPHKKQLHVTLAYNFPTDHLASLEKLAKGIEVKLGCDWLAVLFSRDIRFANHEVLFILTTIVSDHRYPTNCIKENKCSPLRQPTCHICRRCG